MEGSSRMRLHWLLLLTGALLAAGCSSGEQDRGAPVAERESAAEREEVAAEADTSLFTPVGDSRVSGDVRFTRRGDTLTVRVYARMATPGDTDYETHIHTGTCQAPGPVAVPLRVSTAGEMGIAEATSEMDVGELQAGGSYIVLIHTQGGAPAGCAPVPTSMLHAPQGGGP